MFNVCEILNCVISIGLLLVCSKFNIKKKLNVSQMRINEMKHIFQFRDDVILKFIIEWYKYRKIIYILLTNIKI